MEEGTEVIGRLKAYLAGDKNVKIPVMTSRNPGWRPPGSSSGR